MGFGRFLKSMVNPEALGEEIIANQEKGYRICQQNDPNAEPHELLAQVWMSRMIAWGKNPSDEGLQMLAFTETMQFACVPYPSNARALGLFFIYKEKSEIIERYPKFADEFMRIMSPVMKAAENNQLYVLYEKYNPRLAEAAKYE